MVEKPERLMILDDDANLLKTLGAALELEGYKVECFKTGKKALDAAVQTDFAAALVDLNLSDMSGLEVLRNFKEKSPNTEFILLTGYASQESAIDAINQGAFAYYQKPYSIEQLLLAVKRAIEKRISTEALHKNHAALTALINAVDQSIFLIELDGTIITVNETPAKLMKANTQELIGRSIYDFFPMEDIKKEKKYIARVFKTGIPEKFEVEHHGRFIELSVYPVKDDSGNVCQLAISGNDNTEQRNSEIILRESEQRHRTISEMISDYAYSYEVKNNNQLILEWITKAFTQVTGFTAEESEKRGGWSNLIHPEDMPIALNRAKRLLSGKDDISEFRIITKSGETRWIRDHGKPIRDQKTKQVIRIYGAAKDITDQKRAEQAIKESETRFRKLYENSPSPYQSLDPEGKILEVNNAWLEELGYKSEEVVGKWFGDFLPEDQKQLFKSRFERFKAVGVTHGNEFDVQRKSGELITISFDGRANLDEKGKFLRSHCIFTNITDRKNAENALRHSEELLRFILKHDPNAIAVYDNDLHYIAVSDRYLKDYNVREEDILGRHHYEVFPEMPEKWREVHKRCLAGAVESNDDDHFVRPDGTITYNRWECRPWRKADGSIGGIITYTEVTTEQKKYEQEIIRRTEQVATINEMGQALAQTMDINRIYSLAYHYVGELVDRPNFCISLVNKSNRTLETAYLNSDGQEININNLPPIVLNPKLKGGRSGAINKMAPVIIDDLKPETAKGKNRIIAEKDSRLRSALYVPMIVDGMPIGLLEVQSCKKAAYAKEDAELLGIAANAIGQAINNTRLFQDLRLQSTALNAAGNSIVITDIDGNLEWVNEAFCELTGYSREEVIGHNPRGLVRTRLNPASVYKELWDTILAGKIWRGTLINRRKNGSIFTEEQTITPVRNEKGEIIKFIGIKLDVSERDQRERELMALTNISAALRKAPSRSDLLPVLLDELMVQMKIDGASLETLDAASGELIVEIGRGIWARVTGKIIPPGEGISAAVLKSGEPYLDNKIAEDKRLLFREDFKDCRAAASVPLFVQDQIIGLLWIGSRRELDANDLRLLISVADIAANAIHRASLHEETQNKVQQLKALRTIDLAINSSLDLRVTLGVIVGQAPQIIDMDALAVLIYNKRSLTLDYAAGSGFRTKTIEDTHVRIGSGLAGKAALERHFVSIPNLQNSMDIFTRKTLVELEGFKSYHAFPLIVKGEIQGILEAFHRRPFVPDEDWTGVLESLATQAAIAIDNSSLFTGLQRSNFNLTQSYNKTIEGWSKALDLRDKETEGHTQRVTELTVKLARLAGISEENLVHVRRGALLHDIGKMGVPDSILLKPDKLTDEEWVIMRKHPSFANDLISPIAYLQPALDIPYCHHEKWDGSGYPRGLKGEAIPLAARLFAVIDVFDALTSDRPYRKAWDEEKAISYIREQSGTHFDPRAIELFERLNLA